ncbi:ATP-binding protein [Gordonia sp. PP30]|uniref:AAA family ATPase n=1 Tax=unclassified Gordonia (in: high G+C Gram-positive bacteria) TaxID=2657482 RepID=UPI001FFEE853|nr:ATP-binding protein [Gordonia sp. PP30]UQE75965.1 ATP-binding protein [Gordonia sp. PP30]
MRNPEDIFTPKTIATREMFERRNERDLDDNPGLQDSLGEALRELGGQVVIYGDTGVGKSSLLRYASEDESMECVIVECLSSKNYDDLMEDALRKLIDVKEIKRTSRKSGSAGIEAGGTVKLLVSLKGKLNIGAEKAVEFEVVQKSPLDALVEAMMKTGKRVLVLDNFQNIVRAEDRRLVAETMEFLSDRAAETGDIKIAVIGIAEDAPSLIHGSGSFRRRVTEIGVPRMPDEEIRSVLKRGFEILEVDVDRPVLDNLVFYSDGFPYFAHLLGLYLARESRRLKGVRIDESKVEPALKRAVKSVDQSFADRIERAFEVGGEIRPRKSILHLLAQSGLREWKSADVISAWEAEYGSRDAYQFLHVALAALLDEAHGSMLRRKGTRNKYIYQFSDPYMRPYLRLTAIR